MGSLDFLTTHTPYTLSSDVHSAPLDCRRSGKVLKRKESPSSDQGDQGDQGITRSAHQQAEARPSRPTPDLISVRSGNHSHRPARTLARRPKANTRRGAQQHTLPDDPAIGHLPGILSFRTLSCFLLLDYPQDFFSVLRHLPRVLSGPPEPIRTSAVSAGLCAKPPRGKSE